LFEGSFRSASCKNSDVLVLTDLQLYAIGKTGLESQVAVPSDSLLAAEFRDRPLLLTLSALQRTE
jgi:hypothetical protein